MDWFAVRHVIKNHDLYEERITLWRSKDADDAIEEPRWRQTSTSAYGTTPLSSCFRRSSRSDSATHQPTGLKCSH